MIGTLGEADSLPVVAEVVSAAAEPVPEEADASPPADDPVTSENKASAVSFLERDSHILRSRAPDADTPAMKRGYLEG